MAPAEHCGRHDAHRPLPSTRHLRGNRTIQLVGQARPTHHHALFPPLNRQPSCDSSTPSSQSLQSLWFPSRPGRRWCTVSGKREKGERHIRAHSSRRVAGLRVWTAHVSPQTTGATVRHPKERTHRSTCAEQAALIPWATQLGSQQHQQQPTTTAATKPPRWLAPGSTITPWLGDPRTLSMTTPVSSLLTRLGRPKLHKAWRNSRVRLI